MSFAWPHLLWLLALPVALLIWELTHRRRINPDARPKMLRAHAGARHLELVPEHAVRSGVRWWLSLGLALSVIALARPQWGRIEEQVFDQSREILIAVDLSRSMLAQDVKPSRLDRAKLLIQALLERLEGERVGLIVFSGTAFLQSPLSADYEILREFLPALDPDYLPQGGSNYGALLSATLQAFGTTGAADRFLIVLSDGEATDEEWKTQLESVKAKNVRVIGLGVGTPSGAMLPDGSGGFVKDERGAVVLSKLEPATLQELARATNGVYRDASSWVDLPALLRETVETGREGDFTEKNQVRLAERFQWALAPAVLCLLLSFWREFPVRPRPRELALSAADRSRKTENSKIPAAVAVLCLLLSVLCSPSSTSAAESETPDDPADPLAAPLAKVVGRLADQPKHLPTDWAELARTTVTYGQHLQSSQQQIPEGPIRDALQGVDVGSAQDAKAADWAQLRKDLEALLQKSQEQQQQQQQQNQDQQNQNNGERSDDSNQQKQDQKGGEDQQTPEGKSPSESQKQEDPSASDNSSEPQNEKQSEQQESAFDDMQEEQKPPPPPSNETQKVGGTPEKQGAPKDIDPALTLPLQKLEQLRDLDSPAKLFQMLEGEKKSDPRKKGKDW